MEQDQKRIFLAVLLSGVFIFAWQSFFPPATPPVEKERVVETGSSNQETQTTLQQGSPKQTDSQQASSPTKTNGTDATAVIVPSTETSIGNENTNFLVNQNLSILDAKSSFSKKEFGGIVGTEVPFQIEVYNGASFVLANFQLTSTGPGSWIAKDENLGLEVRLNQAENEMINYSILSNSPKTFQFVFNTKNKELENRQMRNFYYLDKELNTVEVGDDNEDEAEIKWAGIDFDYHIFLITFDNRIPSTLKFTENGKLKLKTIKPQSQIQGSLVFSHKEYDHLAKLGSNLDLAVDFGMWAIIAVPILRGLQFFYDFIPNYGIAIILITLILRLITFPLQYKSIKSMKKMQTIQPELNRLKEKFKDDPQRMQRETMELFKKSGYNPLGGCFPMLLQIPVFFAFYRVLYNAVELVDAPFFGWIQDLSNKDPYYVLPVLMGLAFFGQQKLTPTPTADPTQAKVMMFMPLVFTFIMKDLPSGLTLYIFVSTLFGILQQFFMQRSK